MECDDEKNKLSFLTVRHHTHNIYRRPRGRYDCMVEAVIKFLSYISSTFIIKINRKKKKISAFKETNLYTTIINIFLQVRPENFHYITRIHYHDHGDGIYGEHEIDYILFLQKDLEVNPNAGEVNEVLWLKRESLDKQIASLKYPLTPWFKLIYESGKLSTWWNNLDRLNKFEDYSKIHKLN